MKAMLFAAGLGTRLRPLTNEKPKALIEVGGVPLLEVAIRRLKKAGCRELILNVHHFADQVTEFLEKKNHFGLGITISDERKLLLDTGGGLKKAAWFFDDGEPFLVCNVDVLTSMDFNKFYQSHLQSGALATLAIRRRITSRYLLFDENLQLRGWENVKSGKTLWSGKPVEVADLKKWSFSGIHALSPAIFSWMPEVEVFSIIEVYLKAAASCPVKGYPHDGDFWLDAGTPEALKEAEQEKQEWAEGIL